MPHHWSPKYTEYKQRNPCITKDREAPEWFLSAIRKHDDWLRVEWWNHPPGVSQEPSFRLVRVNPVDDTWAHVKWFRVPSYAVLEWLRRCDTRRLELDGADVYRASLREAEAEIEAEEARRHEQCQVSGEDFINECYRHKENTTYWYPKG